MTGDVGTAELQPVTRPSEAEKSSRQPVGTSSDNRGQAGGRAEAGGAPLQQRIQERLSYARQQSKQNWEQGNVIETYKEFLELRRQLQGESSVDEGLKKELEESTQQLQQKIIKQFIGDAVTRHGSSEPEGGSQILEAHVAETPLTELAKELGQLEVVKQLGIRPDATYNEIISQISQQVSRLAPEEVRKIQQFGYELKEAAAYLALKPQYLEDARAREALHNLYNAGVAIAGIGNEGRQETDATFAERFVHELTPKRQAELTVFILTGKTGETLSQDASIPRFYKKQDGESEDAYYGRILSRDLPVFFKQRLLASMEEGKAARKIREEIASGVQAVVTREGRQRIATEAFAPHVFSPEIAQGETFRELFGTQAQEVERLLGNAADQAIAQLRERLRRDPTREEIATSLARLIGQYKPFGADSIANQHMIAQLYSQTGRAEQICVSSDYILASLLLQKYGDQFKGYYFAAEPAVVDQEGHMRLIIISPDGESVMRIDPTQENPLEKIEGKEAKRLIALYGKGSREAQDPDRVFKQLEAAVLFNKRLNVPESERKQFVDQAYALDPTNFLIVLEKARLSKGTEQKRLLEQVRSLRPDLSEEQFAELLSKSKSQVITSTLREYAGMGPGAVGNIPPEVQALLQEYLDNPGAHARDTVQEALDRIVLYAKGDLEYEFYLESLEAARDDIAGNTRGRTGALQVLLNKYGAGGPPPVIPPGSEEGQLYQALIDRRDALNNLIGRLNLLAGGAAPGLVQNEVDTVPAVGGLSARAFVDTQVTNGDLLGLYVESNRPQGEEQSAGGDLSTLIQRIRVEKARAVPGSPEDGALEGLINRLSAERIIAINREKEDLADPDRIEQRFQETMVTMEQTKQSPESLLNTRQVEYITVYLKQFEQAVEQYRRSLPEDPNRLPFDDPKRIHYEDLQERLRLLKHEHDARQWLYDSSRIIGENFEQEFETIIRNQKKLQTTTVFPLFEIEDHLVSEVMRKRSIVAERFIRKRQRIDPATLQEMERDVDNDIKEWLKSQGKKMPAWRIARATALAKYLDNNFYHTGKRAARVPLPEGATGQQYAAQVQGLVTEAFNPLQGLHKEEALSALGKAWVDKLNDKRIMHLYYMGDMLTYGANRQATLIALNEAGLKDSDLYLRLRQQFANIVEIQAWAAGRLSQRGAKIAELREEAIKGRGKRFDSARDREAIQLQIDNEIKEWDEGTLYQLQTKADGGTVVDTSTGVTHTFNDAGRSTVDLLTAITKIEASGNATQDLQALHALGIATKQDVLARIAETQTTIMTQMHFWGEGGTLEILDFIGGGGAGHIATAGLLGTAATPRERGEVIFELLDKVMSGCQSEYSAEVARQLKTGRDLLSKYSKAPPGLLASLVPPLNIPAGLTSDQKNDLIKQYIIQHKGGRFRFTDKDVRRVGAGRLGQTELSKTQAGASWNPTDKLNELISDSTAAGNRADADKYKLALEMYSRLQQNIKGHIEDLVAYTGPVPLSLTRGSTIKQQFLNRKAIIEFNGQPIRFNRNVITETDVDWEVYALIGVDLNNNDLENQPSEENVTGGFGQHFMNRLSERVLAGIKYAQAIAEYAKNPVDINALIKIRGVPTWLDVSEDQDLMAEFVRPRMELFRYESVFFKQKTIDKMYKVGGIGLSDRLTSTVLSPFKTRGPRWLQDWVNENRIPLPGWAMEAIEGFNNMGRLHLVPFSESRGYIGWRGLKLSPQEMHKEIMDLVAKGVMRPEDAKDLERWLKLALIFRSLPWMQTIIVALIMTMFKDLRGIFEGR